MPVRRLLPIAMLFILALIIATSANADGPGRRIVVFRTGISEAAQDAAIRGAGGRPIKPVRLVNATVAELTSEAARGLSHRPDVLRVDDDAEVTIPSVGGPSTVQGESRTTQGNSKKWNPPSSTPAPTSVPTNIPTVLPTSTAVPTLTPTPIPSPTATASPTASPAPTSSEQTLPWGISRIKAPESWSISRGALVKVAVIDTGISTSHPDLVVAGGVSQVAYTTSFNDDNGHGSHVAGILTAADNAGGVVGVAPSVSLYAIKALDGGGSGYISDIINGLDWAIANGIQVINMSLGTASDVQSFREAIAKTYDAGVVMVAAAGNSGGSYSVTYPAAYDEVIAVSALDINNNIPSWSSNGPQVDLAAPGESIYSTYKGATYAIVSGTSMASPHVAGVAALRKELYPSESPAQVAAALQRSATLLPGLTAYQQGSGLVDAYLTVTAP